MKWIKRGNTTNVKDLFLNNMGVTSLDDINNWFKKSYSNGYKIKNLPEAVAFAKKFIDKPVLIIGDYDVDGTTGTTILYNGLTEYGFKNVRYRIPRRFTEGFGINDSIIDEINTGLIITCDNGIAGLSAIKKAKEKGLSVIVIDHHEPVIEDGIIYLPDADYIIDPNAIYKSADFNGYCGAGLAYKFICELFNYEKAHTQKYLGLAAIGTVADVMKLHEENYVIVRNGLKALSIPSLCTKGLNALLSTFNLLKNIKASDIAYTIGPAINSSSRMKDDGANSVVELLIYDEKISTALNMAESLKETNELRKKTQKIALEFAHEIIERDKLENACPITLYIPSIHEGIIGIIAGNLCEEYKVPVLVFTDNFDQNGVHIYKGSARSCGNYHIKKALDRNSSLLLKYGGHAEAAGVSILPEHFNDLKNMLYEDAKDFEREDKNTIFYDIEISPEEVLDTIKLMKSFEPYGEGNPEPIILLTNFIPCLKYGSYRRILGKDNTTIKINSQYLDALGFGMADKFKNIRENSSLNIVGKLSENMYKETITPQIQIKDFLVA